MKEIIISAGLLALATIGFGQTNSPWRRNGDPLNAGDFIGSTNTQPMVFKTDNNERMRILGTGLGTGSVGIGLTTPSQVLDVNGNIGIRGTHLVYHSQFGVIDWGGSGVGDLIFRSLTTQGVIDAPSYTDRMTITNNGRLILGQHNSNLFPLPPSNDQVYIRTSGYTGLTIEQNGNTPLRSALTLYHANGGRQYGVGSTGLGDATGAGNFVIRDVIGQADRLIMNPTGDLALGAIAPTQKLDVDGNISVRGTHVVFNSQHGVIDWGSGGFGDLFFRHINNGVIGSYTDLAHIKYNGNFAIGGGFDPLAKVHIQSAVERESFRIYKTGNTAAYLSLWNGDDGAAIDPVFSGKLFLGYDQATDVRIGGNAGAFTNQYSKLGIGVPAPANIDAFVHIQTPDVPWHGILLDHKSNTPCTVQEIRLKNVGSKAFVVSRYISANTTQEVFRVWSDGKVMCTEVNVQLTPFPDYVFSKSYDLMSLNNLEDYINENHHLPNVPTAKEVESNGANLGELSKIQMEKIEELTLYVIELKKEIEVLKKKVK